MSKLSLEETNYDLIKAHILDPASSPLSEAKQEQLERVMSVIKVLDKNPIRKNAFMLHKQKYPHLSKSTIYEDLVLATKLYNTVHEFEWGFWRSWMINDIVDNILTCKKSKSDKDRRIIAMEHANLIKLIGVQPEELVDPKRSEKHKYYILIQNNHQEVKIDLDSIENLPNTTLKEINRIICAGDEITDIEAEEIMKS